MQRLANLIYFNRWVEDLNLVYWGGGGGGVWRGVGVHCGGGGVGCGGGRMLT